MTYPLAGGTIRSMRDEILSYTEMCMREGMSLQRGMNFRPSPAYSIVLMSQRQGAPYDDTLSEDGQVLEYEGHDVTKTAGVNPKAVDQPWVLPSGRPTENGKFARSSDQDPDHLLQVYEKVKDGIWTDKGLFRLESYSFDWKPSEERVFKFRMRLSEVLEGTRHVVPDTHSRLIPGWVKQAVYKRDHGRCVICGSTEFLHFDHDLPFSRGGASVLPENIRILCARHNLSKGARIE